MSFDLVNRHKNFNKTLWEEVMKQPESVVIAKASPESRKLYNLNREVGREFDKTRSFMRLDVSKHGILYCTFSCVHQIEDMILNHFMNRFPTFVIVLESQRGCFVGSLNINIQYHTYDKLNKVLDYFESVLPVNKVLENVNEFDESVWENYYTSQYVNERKNIKLFLKQMPKKFHKLDKITKSFGNESLEKFI